MMYYIWGKGKKDFRTLKMRMISYIEKNNDALELETVNCMGISS